MSGSSRSPLVPILAQAAPAAGGGEGAMPPWMVLVVQFGPVLLLAFFLFFWMPMQNQKRRTNMIKALKKNDRVLTESGIFGTVVSVDEKADRIVIRIDDEKGVKLTCRKSSIAGLVEAGATDKVGAAEKKAS
ncbi:preprotein translocase subunit YajC [Tautonia plasticadhaerens]|uniref:Sec translocon accessory complex subunit YajC n=1 Tax=Tautonia plasticadhaerens TaxID=2527974 RepID=A0A518GXM2_9BACT|nr:preprotein translocase subunit YajC [Tautonia plasticadhaerens]QDV33348.1 preprotein translocase subunit YajC [Tautonia plasticadhaerens]